MPKSIDKRFRSSKFFETICECLIHLLNFINYSFQHSAFPEDVKLSKMIPLYKKLDLFQKENYTTHLRGFWDNYSQTNNFLYADILVTA